LEKILLLALALMLVIEGIMPMLFPKIWRETFLNLTKYKNGQIRFFGFLSIILGIILFLIVR